MSIPHDDNDDDMLVVYYIVFMPKDEIDVGNGYNLRPINTDGQVNE